MISYAGEESFYDQSQRNHGGFSALHEEVGERYKRQVLLYKCYIRL